MAPVTASVWPIRNEHTYFEFKITSQLPSEINYFFCYQNHKFSSKLTIALSLSLSLSLFFSLSQIISFTFCLFHLRNVENLAMFSIISICDQQILVTKHLHNTYIRYLSSILILNSQSVTIGVHNPSDRT